MLGLVILFGTQRTTAPRRRVMCLFQFGAFFMSMVWIYVLANILVDTLTLVGILTGESTTLLGLTVLSVGNTLGDAIASMAMSRGGFGEMAITGCIAGPVFNLMFGVGLTAIRCNISKPEGIVYPLKD